MQGVVCVDPQPIVHVLCHVPEHEKDLLRFRSTFSGIHYICCSVDTECRLNCYNEALLMEALHWLPWMDIQETASEPEVTSFRFDSAYGFLASECIWDTDVENLDFLP